MADKAEEVKEIKDLVFHDCGDLISVSLNGEILEGKDLEDVIKVLNTPDINEVLLERLCDA